MSQYGPLFGVGARVKIFFVPTPNTGVACHSMAPFLVFGPGYIEASTIPNRTGVACHNMAPFLVLGPGYREPFTIPNRAGVACHNMAPFLVSGPGYREPSTIPNRAGVACHNMVLFWCRGQAIENLSRFQIAPAWRVTICLVFGVGARL